MLGENLSIIKCIYHDAKGERKIFFFEKGNWERWWVFDLFSVEMRLPATVLQPYGMGIKFSLNGLAINM